MRLATEEQLLICTIVKALQAILTLLAIIAVHTVHIPLAGVAEEVAAVVVDAGGVRDEGRNAEPERWCLVDGEFPLAVVQPVVAPAVKAHTALPHRLEQAEVVRRAPLARPEHQQPQQPARTFLIVLHVILINLAIIEPNISHQSNMS